MGAIGFDVTKNTPFDEDDGVEHLENTIIRFCPYCGAVNKSYVEDYYIGSPPLDNTIYITWRCEEEQFCKSFRTEHELTEEGMIR